VDRAIAHRGRLVRVPPGRLLLFDQDFTLPRSKLRRGPDRARDLSRLPAAFSCAAAAVRRRQCAGAVQPSLTITLDGSPSGK